MSQAPDVVGPAVPLQGRLGDPAALPRLFAWLARGEWSGMVVVRAGDVERRVYFNEGRVGTAGSTDPAESLAQALIREGLMTEEDRSRAAGQLRVTDRGWSFGRQLVRAGMLADRDVSRVERRRVIGLVEATLALRTGSYACEPGVVAGDAQPQQALEIPRLVAEGVLTYWDANSALEILGGRDAILDMCMEHLAEHEATGAEEAYDYTLLLCNGARRVDEVLAASPLPEAASLRFLAALRLLDIVSSRPAASAQAQSSPAAQAEAGRDAGGEPAGAGQQGDRVVGTGEHAVMGASDLPAALRRAGAGGAAGAPPEAPASRPAPAGDGGGLAAPVGVAGSAGPGSAAGGPPAAAAGDATAASAQSRPPARPTGAGSPAAVRPRGARPAAAPTGGDGSRTAWVVAIVFVLLAATAFFAWAGWRELTSRPQSPGVTGALPASADLPGRALAEPASEPPALPLPPAESSGDQDHAPAPATDADAAGGGTEPPAVPEGSGARP